MNVRIAVICVTVLVLSLRAQGRPDVGRPSKDTLPAREKKTGRFSRLLYQTISVTPRDKEAEMRAAKADQEYFEQFAGKKIGDIRIVRENVFNPHSKVWGERKTNAMHRITQESKIRRDLFIKPGDRFDPLLVTNIRQLIRSRSYIADANIRVIPATPDSSVVDLIVTTRDRWTIGIDLNSQSDGNTYFELYDDNILGWGNKLSVKTYFNWKNWSYGGNLFEYENPNILGSFVEGRIIAGKGFNYSDYGAEFKKEFIRPSDYTLGGYGYYRREPIDIDPLDSTINTSLAKWGVWGGKSFYIKNLKSSFFITAHYNTVLHRERPEVSQSLNPYFHNENLVLFNTGFYKEQFRTSSLIYGYGVNEDIPYGYQFSLTGGPSWGEFGNRWYLGGKFSAGNFTSFGYLRWSFALGSYLNNRDGRFYRTALVSNLNWFSNLMGKGRYRVRQFIDVNLTRGWNRMDGYRESFGFEDNAELRGLGEEIYGNNRLVVNSETVVFTPWHLYQFRFALYGFADLGILGYNGNLFKNGFYSTIGIGVRIKNEHLIFRTINIRLGFAVGRTGLLNANYFHINTEDKRQPIRYRPQKATVTDYEDNTWYGWD